MRELAKNVAVGILVVVIAEVILVAAFRKPAPPLPLPAPVIVPVPVPSPTPAPRPRPRPFREDVQL